MTSSVARLLLDLGGVKQGGDNCRGAYAHRHAGFHQLGAALFGGLVEIVVTFGHAAASMAFAAGWEAA